MSKNTSGTKVGTSRGSCVGNGGNDASSSTVFPESEAQNNMLIMAMTEDDS